MKQAIGAALAAGGGVLLYFGLKAKDSAGSRVEEFFTGSPSDDATMYLVGGVAALVAGLTLIAIAFGKKKD